MKLSERIRQFTFNMSELHGTKDDAQRFFRGWQAEVAALEAENRGLHLEAREQVALIHDEQAKVAALEAELGGHFLTDDGRKLRGLEWQAYLQTEMGKQGLELRALKARLSKMEEAMLTASKRVRKGLPGPPLHFRCSHCGKSTPIIINRSLALAHEALAGEE